MFSFLCKDEGNFELKNISEKDFGKILLHLKAKLPEGIQLKVGMKTKNTITFELKPVAIMTMFLKEKKLSLSTHKVNIGSFKELFKTCLECDCIINKTIDESKNMNEAVVKLDEDARKKWEKTWGNETPSYVS